MWWVAGPKKEKKNLNVNNRIMNYDEIRNKRNCANLIGVQQL